MRKLSLSYIIETGFSVFKKNILNIILIVLAVSVPASLIQYFLIDSKFDYSELYNSALEIANESTEEIATTELMAVYKKMLIYYAVTLLVASIFLIAQCAVIKITKNAYKGEENDFSSSFEVGFMSYPKACLTAVLYYISVFVGMIFCFVPGFIFAYIFSLANQSVVLSGKWGSQALRESASFIRKKPVLCFLAQLCVIGFNIVISLLFSLILSFITVGGIAGLIIEVILTFLQHLISMFPVCCISVLCLSISEEINGISAGEGVIVDAP